MLVFGCMLSAQLVDSAKNELMQRKMSADWGRSEAACRVPVMPPARCCPGAAGTQLCRAACAAQHRTLPHRTNPSPARSTMVLPLPLIALVIALLRLAQDSVPLVLYVRLRQLRDTLRLGSLSRAALVASAPPSRAALVAA